MRTFFLRGLCFPFLFLFLTVFAACLPDSPVTSASAYFLGTNCSIRMAGGSRELLDQAFARVSEIEQYMTTDGNTSDVARVNAAAGLDAVTVRNETLKVIAAGLKYGACSGGRFDISIGPLVALWDIGAAGTRRVPEKTEIEALLPLVSYSDVVLDGNTVYLPRKGQALDLGGIAKGYAADQVASMLREAGIESALLDFGGNILVVGTKSGGQFWTVGVQDPGKPRGEYLGILTVRDRAIVTSGPYERFFIQDGVRYHHILDPASGYPADAGLIGSTIVCKKSITADAYSTAVYVAGMKEGLALIDADPEIEGILVGTDGSIAVSSGLEPSFRLTNTSYRQIPLK